MQSNWRYYPSTITEKAKPIEGYVAFYKVKIMPEHLNHPIDTMIKTKVTIESDLAITSWCLAQFDDTHTL